MVIVSQSAGLSYPPIPWRMASAASVVSAARQQLRGEWSEWAPVWRRPSRGPGSRSQSADPLGNLAPLGEKEKDRSHEPRRKRRPEGSSGSRQSLLKPRSQSSSSESLRSADWQFPEGLEGQEGPVEGGWPDPEMDAELLQLEQELEDKQLKLTEVKANGRALEERLEATERDARHFGETVMALEAGLQDATVEEHEPHRELRHTMREGKKSSEPSLDNLVDEWARARAAIGLS